MRFTVAEIKSRRAKSRPAGDTLFFGDAPTGRLLVEALKAKGEMERATHGFHTYPAGLHPEAARILLSLGSGPVLDPFCGGGTVLVESLLAGRPALGLDVSPVATIVSRARTIRTDEALRTSLRSRARAIADQAKNPTFASAYPPDMAKWYDSHTLGELCMIRDSINALPNDQKELITLLRAVFSSILVKVSNRESDTANHKVERQREPGSTAILFHARAREYSRQLEALETAIGDHPDLRVQVHRKDAREFRGKEEFGQVVTSPPYPGVYDYLAMQQLRWAWLGLEEGPAHAEIGSRHAFRVDRSAAIVAWRRDTARWVKSMSKALTIGGRLMVVLGDGMVGHRSVEAIPAVLEAAKPCGLQTVARCTAERWDEGIHGLRPEHILVLEKRAVTPA